MILFIWHRVYIGIRTQSLIIARRMWSISQDHRDFSAWNRPLRTSIKKRTRRSIVVLYSTYINVFVWKSAFSKSTSILGPFQFYKHTKKKKRKPGEKIDRMYLNKTVYNTGMGGRQSILVNRSCGNYAFEHGT